MEDKSASHITCEHLLSIKQSGGPEHTVIDLRDPVEFDAGHIEDSVNIPRRELTANIESVIPHRSHRIIAVIGPTHDSEMDTIREELTSMGYEKIEFLVGGFDRWCEITMPSVEDVTGNLTPEEMGAVSDETKDQYEGVDPEEENEPLM